MSADNTPFAACLTEALAEEARAMVEMHWSGESGNFALACLQRGFDMGLAATPRPQPTLADEDLSQLLQDFMEQHHGRCLRASEWDAIVAFFKGRSSQHDTRKGFAAGVCRACKAPLEATSGRCVQRNCLDYRPTAAPSGDALVEALERLLTNIDTSISSGAVRDSVHHAERLLEAHRAAKETTDG